MLFRSSLDNPGSRSMLAYTLDCCENNLDKEVQQVIVEDKGDCCENTRVFLGCRNDLNRVDNTDFCARHQ